MGFEKPQAPFLWALGFGIIHAMNNSKVWYVRTSDGKVYGPADMSSLVKWAEDGRVDASGFVSKDRITWTPAQLIDELAMTWLVEVEPGIFRGPYNRKFLVASSDDGSLPASAKLYRRHDLPVGEDDPPTIVEKEVIREVPVEKIVEKEVVKEVIKEVPVERVVEKTLVDETRVKELEALLAAEESRAKGLEEKLAAEESRAKQLEESVAATARAADESSKAYAGEKAANEKLREQVAALEDELRRLPQTASEIADIQAAVYSIMTGEAEELLAILDADKKEFEEFSRRHQDRAERLAERRRTLLKRAGTNIEDMTKRALVMRPEDPRTARIAKEYEEFRRLAEKRAADSERQVRDLSERLRTSQAETQRAAAGARDVTQLRTDIEELKAKLQLREKELLAEKQANDDLRRQQATRQQVLMTRLAALESPSIGTAQSMSTNQSREARLVKLPSWMRLGK